MRKGLIEAAKAMTAFAVLSFVLADSAASQTRIVAFGDSNTYGQGLPRGDDYPSKLEALLKSKGYNVQVVNAGIGGNTTADALSRVDSAVPAGTAVAIVQFGVNDARRGVPPSTIEQNLDQVLARIKAKGARIVLCGRRAPFPPGYDIDGYRAVYGKLVRKYGAVGCVFTAGIPPSGFQADGHENSQGTTVVANNIAKIVTPMLKK